MRSIRSLIALGSLCLLAAARSIAAQSSTGFIQATAETIHFTLDSVLGLRFVKEIWVENRSTVPIKIVGVELSECQNVSQPCAPNRANAKVEPGNRRMVFRVRPKSPGGGVGFRYRVLWMPDSAAFTANMRLAMQVLASAKQPDDASHLEDTSAMRHAIEEQLARTPPRELTADEKRALAAQLEARLSRGPRPAPVPPPLEPDLSPDEIRTLGDKIASWRVDPDSTALKPGDVMRLGQIRIVAIGAEGNRLGRFRGQYRFRFEGDAATLAPRDTVVAVKTGRLTIVIAPTDALNASRTKPFGQLRFTIIVP